MKRMGKEALTALPFFPSSAKIPAIDIILLFAAAEGDLPKIEEARGKGSEHAAASITDIAPAHRSAMQGQT